MQPTVLLIGLLISVLTLRAADAPIASDVTQWQEVEVPTESRRAAREAWFTTANQSRQEWRVFTKEGQPQAQLKSEAPTDRPDRPSFTPEAGDFRGASRFVAVDDGWLVGFNRGEFGGALYWFSADGASNYKVSHHLVVDFLPFPGGIHAIEGVEHLGQSRGSVIHVARPQNGERWQATTIAKLPFAPYAASVRRDGTLLVTLSDSLVSIGPDRNISNLLSAVPWSGLYPNSSVLSSDERTLYIGMRQFVGEFDLATKKLRLLVPPGQLQHPLPTKDHGHLLLWLSTLPSMVFLGYLVHRYIVALRVSPKIGREDLVYEERFASGASQRNILTKIGGARNCLRLVVTRDILWVTSWFPFSLLATVYDLEHVIPLRSISSVELSRYFGSDTLLLTYSDESGTTHILRLIPKNRERFLAAIQFKPDLSQGTSSPLGSGR